MFQRELRIVAIYVNVTGYVVKQSYAAFQSVQLDDKGTDCKSKAVRLVALTESNKDDFLYRYIIDGNKLVVLDDKNINKYIGRLVKMRSAMYCTTDKICNVCAGDLYYKLGIKNAGLTATKIGSNLLNLAMKSFHDSSIKVSEIKANNILL